MNGVMRTVLLLFLVSLTAAGQIDQARWARAEREIRRLTAQPSLGLPRSVSRYLRRHGYTIPQAYDLQRPHNAVRGHFDGDATWDWAVLGSLGGRSEILVFWGGSVARVTRLARRFDASYLQTVGDDRIGYSRSVSAVGQQYILDHYHEYGGPKPPPIRHDAIDDAFSGKASVVYYFDSTRWHTLQGAD
jgi:hypothetical protein